MSKLGFLLFVTTILLSVIGIFILYESSSYTALLNVGDKYYFIKNQILWVFLGIVSCISISFLSYKRLYNLALPLLLFTIFLLVLVFVPGLGLKLKGAHRWLDLRLFVLQPSELLKVSLGLYLAAWLSNKEKGRLVAFLILFGLCIFLVAIEPDFGTAFIIAVTSVVIYFLSGAKTREIIAILLILVLGSIALIKMEPYRMVRFTSFSEFDSRDISTSSYHIKQILISLGSSGLTGVGFGKSVQKYAYLPENTTDSIFAIYAEESGFLGSVFLMFVFFMQLLLGFLIALRIKDKFAKLLAGGIITFLGVQTLVNLASQAVLIPLTGIPLPFISYGGSSMLINFTSIGILLSISRSIDV